MQTQTLLCLFLFILLLSSYMIPSLPMWAVAILSIVLFYMTGCVDAQTALAGFSNENTIVMSAMMVISLGFSRTSLS